MYPLPSSTVVSVALIIRGAVLSTIIWKVVVSLSFPSLSTALTNTLPLKVSVSVYPEATVVQLAPPSFEYINSLIPEPSTTVPEQEVLSVDANDTTTLEPVQFLPS